MVWRIFLNKSFEKILLSINPQSFFFPKESQSLKSITSLMHLCFIFAKNHSKHRYRTKIEKKTPRENSQMQILHRNQPIEPGATKLASAKLHKRLTENLLTIKKWNNVWLANQYNILTLLFSSRRQSKWKIKFRYSGRPHKFGPASILFWHYLVASNYKWKMVQIFLTFSEYHKYYLCTERLVKRPEAVQKWYDSCCLL